MKSRRLWIAGVVLLALVAGVAYLVWGCVGLVVLGGGAVGLGLAIILGPSSPGSEQDAMQWNWDGSAADGCSSYGPSIFDD